MTNEQIKFIAEIVNKISCLKHEFRSWDFSLEFNHHEGKDYWTIDLSCQKGNSKFSDCVCFWPDDSFNEEEIMNDLDDLISKGKFMTK